MLGLTIVQEKKEIGDLFFLLCGYTFQQFVVCLRACSHKLAVIVLGQQWAACKNIFQVLSVMSQIICLSVMPFWWWASTPQNMMVC